MHKRLLIPAVGLFMAAASSPFWLVTAADSSATARLANDVTLTKDSDLLTGFIPARTTIARLFENHLIERGEGTVLVSSIASAMDVRRLRAGQPYTLDRLLDGRVRRFEYEIDGDRRL